MSVDAVLEILPALFVPGVLVACDVSVDVLVTEFESVAVGEPVSVDVAVVAEGLLVSVVEVEISVTDNEVESVGEALSVVPTEVESAGAGDGAVV